MPEKYHIKTKPVPPRRPRIGKYGIVDWREDCSRCHNCVKKACIYDRHREEAKYIKNLGDVDSLFFDCMGCFSCVQECTKDLLCLTINSQWEALGNRYWTPDIIQATWLQAETAKIPVSGAGYGGKYAGHGFDAMWTDMSEIVRPTRDGIHGREYISTAVDIGRKPSFLVYEGAKQVTSYPPFINLPMPLIVDIIPEQYELPELEAIILETMARTDLIAVIDSAKWPGMGSDLEKYLHHIAFYLNPDAPAISDDILKQTRIVELPDSPGLKSQIESLRKLYPSIVIAVRIPLDSSGVQRAIEVEADGVDAVHIVADINGDELNAERPRFIKDMIREIHTALIKNGKRDEITLIAGGGIALAEHLAKALLCGTDLVSIELPLLVGLECHLCKKCGDDHLCPAKIRDIDMNYGAGRMTNLIGAWHGQLIEVMGAMGMRDARRLRGDVGRAMFFEELEEELFGSIFGTRRQA